MILCKIIDARDWAFKYGTNLAQLLNIAYASVFIYIFGFANSAVNTAPIYSAFAQIEQSKWWLVMVAIVVFQIVFMVIKSVRCDVLSGFVLMVSFPIWTFIAISFVNSGFANTGIYIYGIWAFTCFMSGWRMMDLYNYQLIVKRRGKANAASANLRDKRTDNTARNICDNRRIDGR